MERFERLKAQIPWYLKIPAKIILSRLPLPYQFWRRIQLFRHGTMDDPAVAIAIFESVLRATGLGPRIDGMSVLELGPGDSLGIAAVAAAFGAASVTLVDVGHFARQDFAPYAALINALRARNFDVTALEQAKTLPDLLERCHAQVLTAGLQSVAALPPASVDLVCSKAVLEHVRFDEFVPMMHALARVMKPSAVGFHVVDLQDHLAYGLNNLRFSDAVWESSFMARSGFYTNRIHYSEMLRLFEEAGFHTEVTRVHNFEKRPLPQREDFAPRFRSLKEEELGIADFDVVLRPRPPGFGATRAGRETA